MRCPLCSGPVHQDDGAFECEVGHGLDGEELVEASARQLAEALWMAMEALDNEAEVLRAVNGADAGRFADDAARQSQLLRDFARAHIRRERRPA